ncbi:hypothetical protein ACHAW6_002355 [Cyclotella cf. meneghiniana]
MKKTSVPLANCNVLFTGRSGPVGQALIDLAAREGAWVITMAHQMHEEPMQISPCALLWHLTRAEWFPVNPKRWLPLKGQKDVVVDSLCMDGYKSSDKAFAPDGFLICTGNLTASSDNDDSAT